MNYRNRRGRPTAREQAERINAGHELVVSLIQDPKKAAEYRDLYIKALPPKRDKVFRPVDRKPVVPLEKDVLASVLQALRHDPRVWICDRRQSGVFMEGDRYITVGQKGHLDISGMLKGGKYYEIECKRPGEKPNAKQQERIDEVRRGGGISGYCWSIESALALLP